MTEALPLLPPLPPPPPPPPLLLLLLLCYCRLDAAALEQAGLTLPPEQLQQAKSRLAPN
jgi:hypothetical protein